MKFEITASYSVEIFFTGYGYESVPSSSYSLEDENDKMTDELKDKINTLKSLSIDISDEVKYQDKLLQDMVRIAKYIVKSKTVHFEF